MPKLNDRLPKYRKHTRSGRAVVTLSGKDFYLGNYGTKASKAEYDRLVGEWAAKGRPSLVTAHHKMTVSELILLYWGHARKHYVKHGRPTDEQAGVRSALRHVKALYGRTPAEDFGPLALKAVRERMITAGNSRKYINQNVSRIRHMFSWGGRE